MYVCIMRVEEKNAAAKGPSPKTNQIEEAIMGESFKIANVNNLERQHIILNGKKVSIESFKTAESRKKLANLRCDVNNGHQLPQAAILFS